MRGITLQELDNSLKSKIDRVGNLSVELESHLAESANVHGNNGNIEYLEDSTVVKKHLHQIFLNVAIGSQQAFDDYADSVSSNMQNNTLYKRGLNLTSVISIPIGGGGVWLLEGLKTNNTYEWQRLTGYLGSNMFYRTKNTGGIWSPWYKILREPSEEWIDAVLQNGWTGSLQYKKNALNQVCIRGAIVAGTLTFNTIIATLPSAYRPSGVTTIPFVNNSTCELGLVIAPSGSILVREPFVTIGAKGNILINYTYQV